MKRLMLRAGVFLSGHPPCFSALSSRLRWPVRFTKRNGPFILTLTFSQTISGWFLSRKTAGFVCACEGFHLGVLRKLRALSASRRCLFNVFQRGVIDFWPPCGTNFTVYYHLTKLLRGDADKAGLIIWKRRRERRRGGWNFLRCRLEFAA